MNLFYQPNLSAGSPHLDPAESLHATKILRHKSGDHIKVTDGKGTLFHCEILSFVKVCTLGIVSSEYVPKPKHHIHIALAPTKSSDRTEWFIEKSTELGIQKISFLNTQRSERNKINRDRAYKAAISAIKQSGQVWLPEIGSINSIHEIIKEKADQKFIAHVDDENTKLLFHEAIPSQNYIVMIGPEGDFTNEEIAIAQENGFHSISLGTNTLRTETAGIAACHILNIIQNLPAS